MLVPDYWAEAKVKGKINGSQVTIMRFGWSDISDADAIKQAQIRADDAMTRAKNGEIVRRRDHKTSYNGADGLPIREEVVARYNDVVITRNVYGALCLNTPDVLFADIDFEIEPAFTLPVQMFFVLLLVSGMVGYFFASQTLFLVLLASSAMLSFLVQLRHKLVQKLKASPEEIATQTIESFIKTHPEFHLRLYRTPMGLRVLAMHTTFDPNSEAVNGLFKQLNSDPIYAQMCKNQHCFRARISPKPWRIGMERLGPSPGVWPIKKERMSARKQWVLRYTDKAKSFSSCKFVGSYGSNVIDSKAHKVRDLHDKYCLADSDFAIA